MRILVTGSRDWGDWSWIFRELNRICDESDLNYPPDKYGNTLPDPGKVTVVHGDCPRGTDFWCNEWAISNCSMDLVEQHPADWKTYKRRAGFVRNAEMVNLGADLCLAFIMPCVNPQCAGKPIHGSHGATSCATLAEGANIPTTRWEAWT